MSFPEFIIGIDLGTTNSVVSYAREDGSIQVFAIPQLTGPGTIEKQDILPSAVLIPGENDTPVQALVLPWDAHSTQAIGEFARNRGSEIPHRLITSAKSWLCHALVDRNKPILPWEGPDSHLKLSPLAASAAILRHIRDAWDYEMARTPSGFDDHLRMENQEILLTVPASFDAVARELTVKASLMAGLNNVTLLEEPQAACYAWIEASGDNWRRKVEKNDLILVCDIGGGTTDFSLIEVSEQNGELALERIAVGNHLLVGGDNMDLSLAYTVSQKMAEKGTRLDAWQMRGLCHTCRKGKETLLSGGLSDNYPITLLGRGSSLIGGTLKARLSAKDVYRVLLEGFLPQCELSDAPVKQRAMGIREIGLSYQSDPAITRHLAWFLSSQVDESGKQRLPTAVLFNGGVMKAPLLRNRVVEVLTAWANAASGPSLRELPSQDFDRSVARGAVYYGLTRRGGGIRIRGGLNKSYYIGVAASMPAVPGMSAPVKALCVAPFGMEEGTSQTIENQEFVLVVGEPAQFDFLGSTLRHEDRSGEVVEAWEGEIELATTLETELSGDSGTLIPVTLESRATEIGTLEIWCISPSDGRQWRLEFNVREHTN